MKQLEGKKINDMFLRNGEVRAADHRVIHDVYLVKVKSKDQVKEEWDLEKVVKTIPAARGLRPDREHRLQDVTAGPVGAQGTITPPQARAPLSIPPPMH